MSPLINVRSEGLQLPPAARTGAQSAAAAATDEEADDDDPNSSEAEWSPERREAERLVQELMALWGPPMETLSRAGRAFEGLEALLGGGRNGSFDLQVHNAFMLLCKWELLVKCIASFTV